MQSGFPTSRDTPSLTRRRPSWKRQVLGLKADFSGLYFVLLRTGYNSCTCGLPLLSLRGTLATRRLYF